MNLRHLAGECLRALCCCFPLNRNKVYFSCNIGRGYSGNPRAIAEALHASGEKIQMYWLVKTPQDAATLPDYVRPLPVGSIRQAFHSSTAKFWVDNSRKYQKVKRSGQLYMQTWHGFALKRIEADAEDVLDAHYVALAKQDSAMCDLIVSGSGFMTNIFRNSFWYDGEVAQWGSPRNDIFFGDTSALQKKVRDALGLPQDQKILLYAPTFRADGSAAAYGLDAERALQDCERRFGGSWSALIRLHPNVEKLSKGLFPYDGSRILDATRYPDMQELLVAADLLITDYSSSMFDYALQGKPCIRYASDVRDYEKDRNFYFPLNSIPFPMAENNDALSSIIVSYSKDEYDRGWQAFMQEHEFCEDGHASVRCAAWILQHRKDV